MIMGHSGTHCILRLEERTAGCQVKDKDFSICCSSIRRSVCCAHDLRPPHETQRM